MLKRLKKFSLSRYLGLFKYTYTPISFHWFYKTEDSGKVSWKPFTFLDSMTLEEAFQQTDITSDTLIPTDGGRYDVNILSRQRISVYWTETPNEIRRCSWFYKSFPDGNIVPYQEYISSVLEEKYVSTFESSEWHKEISLPNGDVVVFRQPDDIHIVKSGNSNSRNVLSQKPRVVKRGIDELEIEAGENRIIDHLLFIVHGIGSVCDLKFRSVEEVVDQFRKISFDLLQTHYSSAYYEERIHRIEVLPINWHCKLHSDDTGIDRRLKNITLSSAPLLRDFINNTLSDVLSYKSPKYSQTIISVVADELNRLYDLFTRRNPTFRGSVSLGGHSLGSVILFDLLSHQKPILEPDNTFVDCYDSPISEVKKKTAINNSLTSMKLQAGVKESIIQYPQLCFQPLALFALGSPISLFVTTEGLDGLGEEFALPTCPAFFNIFHPYDVIAYRVESLINPELSKLQPVLLPHHKGGKRLHLQFKETMKKVKEELRDKWKKSLQTTLNTIPQMQFVCEEEPNICQDETDSDSTDEDFKSIVDNNYDEEEQHIESEKEVGLSFGVLNKGRRIDYVLQEAPIESFNEYIFAMTLSSHLCYWESEDTMLLILKEIYSSMGIVPDKVLLEQEQKMHRWQREDEETTRDYLLNPPNATTSSEFSFEHKNRYLYMEAPSAYIDIVTEV